MASRKYISEVFSELEKISSFKERVAFLQSRANNTEAMRTCLQGSFDPSIQFFNEGEVPPYKRNAAPGVNLAETNLFQAWKCLKIFLVNHPAKQIRKEKVMIETLEALHPTEANTLEGVVCKDLNKRYKHLTRKLVDAAFPVLLSDSPENKKKLAAANV